MNDGAKKFTMYCICTKTADEQVVCDKSCPYYKQFGHHTICVKGVVKTYPKLIARSVEGKTDR